MMFTETIAFKHWVFEVPSKLTRKIYSNTLCGYSEYNVQEFRSFFKYYDEIFTPEITDLLNRLGIDYKKDTFLKQIQDPDGRHSFVITYQFLGSMHVNSPERMKEPFILDTLEYEPVSDRISVAFYQVEEMMIGMEIIYVEILFRVK
ncbi:hypothetical protein [Fluviicola chungangensis]|uniref:Uncharacterized protein n=1 Tax=Fluviicola chungangensis TaxID=2597671 RepID=A0A556MNX9_9FLAO|nr:hypothetical protein [Fluviicola chungangensis]TSJ41620.1 hypothetical protein FO442_14260 [Fluviicola chungangensis]